MCWRRQVHGAPEGDTLPSARALRRGVQVMGARWQATATRRGDGRVNLRVRPVDGGRWRPGAVAVISLALAPHVAVMLLARLPVLHGLAEPGQLAFHCAVALLRWCGPPLLFGAIGRLPGGGDRLRYHAAEHQVMRAFEAGLPLTMAQVRRQPRVHSRCGGNLALRAATLAAIGQIALGAPLVAHLARFGGPTTAHLALAALELGLVAAAVLVGLRWHDQTVGAKGNAWLAAPGRLAQLLITRPATDAHRQIALYALRAALLGPDAEARDLDTML